MAYHEEELGTYVSKEQILPTATSRRWASYERSRSSLCQASDAIHPKRSCVVRLGHEHVRCVNAPVPVTRIQRDMLEFDDETLAPDTVTDYLAVLRRLFIVWEQGAYNPNLRSSVRVGKKPKRHLADPSLSAAALGVGASDLIGDLNTFGFLFEALCERDLAVYSQSLGGTLLHYRDAQNREIDAVVELPGGA